MGLHQFSTPDQIQEVAPEIFAEQRERAARRLSDAVEDIQSALRVALSEMVDHLRARLTPDAQGKTKRLHQTAVTNLTEFLARFDIRNVTDDRELKQIVDQLRGLLRPSAWRNSAAPTLSPARSDWFFWRSTLKARWEAN